MGEIESFQHHDSWKDAQRLLDSAVQDADRVRNTAERLHERLISLRMREGVIKLVDAILRVKAKTNIAILASRKLLTVSSLEKNLAKESERALSELQEATHALRAMIQTPESRKKDIAREGVSKLEDYRKKHTEASP